jgi:hypothetical protein
MLREFMSRFEALTIAGGLAAMRRASASAVGRRSAAGTTAETSPMDKAAAASMLSPENVSSHARA